MADAEIQRATPSPITGLDVFWITAGLGCDGATIAMTDATQPSIVVLGQIPRIPKVKLHNPFLAAANGDDFLRPFHQAAGGKLWAGICATYGGIHAMDFPDKFMPFMNQLRLPVCFRSRFRNQFPAFASVKA